MTDEVEAGQSVIDLGSYGKLIAPVQVEGAWYYYWDRSGDGTSANTGALNGSVDHATHTVLDGIFTSTLSEVNAGTTGPGTDTTDLIRYANLNGVKVALPTANLGHVYPQSLDSFQNGTSYADAGVSTNGTTGPFNELLVIWDAYNGVGTGTLSNGRPALTGRPRLRLRGTPTSTWAVAASTPALTATSITSRCRCCRGVSRGACFFEI